MSLHIFIEVILCRLNQLIVVGVIIPYASVFGHRGFGAANYNASVDAWDQIVVDAMASPQAVCIVQIRRLAWIRSHNTAAYPSTRHNLLRVLGENTGGEAIRGEDYLGSFNGSSGGGNSVPAIGVRS